MGAAPQSANPFLSATGGGGGGFGAPNPGMFGGGGTDPMSNGFQTLAPEPAPGSQKPEDKNKSADPLFGDLVNSFGADLGMKKKDEFFGSSEEEDDK